MFITGVIKAETGDAEAEAEALSAAVGLTLLTTEAVKSLPVLVPARKGVDMS